MCSHKNNTSEALAWKSGFVWVFFICVKRLNDALRLIFIFIFVVLGQSMVTIGKSPFPEGQAGVALGSAGAAGSQLLPF